MSQLTSVVSSIYFLNVTVYCIDMISVRVTTEVRLVQLNTEKSICTVGCCMTIRIMNGLDESQILFFTILMRLLALHFLWQAFQNLKIADPMLFVDSTKPSVFG